MCLNGRRRKLSLVVDTGATTVVLPSSMIGPLGFAAEDLQDGWSETAGGHSRTSFCSGRKNDLGAERAHNFSPLDRK